MKYLIRNVLGVASPVAMLGLALTFGLTAAHAQTSSEPSTQDIIDALKPAEEMPAIPARRTRGLSLGEPAKPRQSKPAAEAVQSKSVDLSVNFEFNSADLTPQGRELLSKLSHALASEDLSGITSVTLEGHTDGVGSASYNQALSLRRAQSVHDFLQGVPELRSKTFRVVGKGASELLKRDDPADGVNRRVRVLVFYAGNAKQ